MEPNFRIGIPNHPWGIPIKEAVERTFAERAWNFLLHTLPNDQLEPALLRGELDIAARALHLLPVQPTPGIAHAALIARAEPRSHILIHPRSRDSRLFQLAEGARVTAPFAWQRMQLLDFRPDLVWQNWEGTLEDVISALQNDQMDAIVVSEPEAAFALESFPELHFLSTDPREFCPAPGMGGILLQTCEEDLPTRRMLKAIHQPLLAELTNVERKLLRLLGGQPNLPLGAFCQRDPMGHLHIWAACQLSPGDPLHRVQLSSSTTFELAEQVLNVLQ